MTGDVVDAILRPDEATNSHGHSLPIRTHPASSPHPRQRLGRLRLRRVVVFAQE
jgi:hypothetical protein